MKSTLTNLLRLVSLTLGLALALGVANAQTATARKNGDDAKAKDTKSTADAKQPAKPASAKKDETEPTSATSGEDAGDYTVTSSLEFGYRGIRVGGDTNKYKSDLNYKAGPRVFDSSLLLQAKDGKGGLLNSLLVTSTGWGADPTGNMRLSVEKPQAYRFDASYRRLKYYRFLDNFANPQWSFLTQVNPATGVRGYDTRTQLGDFDLTILPKNETISFNVGYSPERYNGSYFSSYHVGGNEFLESSNARHRANDIRVGADGKLGPIDWTFLQGFRRFREDTFIDSVPAGLNTASTAARLTSYTRNEPTRGRVDFTRASAHTLVAKKLDLTARLVYSRAKSTFNFLETFTGVNWNPRITGWPQTSFPKVGGGTVTVGATPNTLNLGRYNITGNTKRPNTQFDLGATFLATDKFRISNTFRIEDFEINGLDVFADFFSITRTIPATVVGGPGTRLDELGFSNLDASEITKYRKYVNTIEGDYQFNTRYSVHFGYRYGKRRVEHFFDGYNLSSQGSFSPANARLTEEEFEENQTNAFFGGFKARPVTNWTVYFDAEHGTADNVFTRIGNYDYTNFRVKSRYAPNRKVNLNLAAIVKNNSNPSEIAGTSLSDFGVSIKSRIFTSSLDWTPTSKLALNIGYNYNWVTSNSLIDYSYFSTTNSAIRGNALFYMRNNFFFIESTARLAPRVTFYSAYRINKDNGQGSRISDLSATGARFLISSYPMNYQSPEARLSIRLNHRLDWNLGYQYYNYNESDLLRLNQPNYIVSPRAQNYHAHLPYMSLRLYIGRKE